ncbi:MAG: helix-turn-helix domain-containing protein [Clostridiales bacterium]|nr:helix-turn-helix domain-containing protein [Clostridiales bacterium]
MINSKFGSVLSTMRKNRSLSQEELAFELDLHRTYISQIERGIKSPSLRVIEKIANYFEITYGELFKLVDDE